MANQSTDEENNQIINCFKNYVQESTTAKKDRMDLNSQNFNAYHLRQDYAHKIAGQSREFIPKVANAVEQNTNMVQQGLMNIGPWFKVEPQAGISEDSMKVKPSTIQRILTRQLEKDGFVNKIGDALKLGMLGSLIIVKVSGKYVNKPKFVAERDLLKGQFRKKLVKKTLKTWQLNLELVRQEDYEVDPTGRGLYEIQHTYVDMHKVMEMAEGKDAIYDKKAVEDLSGSFDSTGSDQDWKKYQETALDPASGGYRKQVKISELWGTILDSEGKVLHENIVCTIANDRFVIQKPTPNPFWHQESPFVTAPLLSVPHSVWGKAMMDAPVRINFAYNELFNLMMDSGLLSVHGIKQIHMDWLEDASQVADGVTAGLTIKANSACPPNAKVLENVYVGGQPQEANNMLNILNQEGAAAMFTSDIRSGGADPKNVRATAIVENSQALNNFSTGMIKNLEGDEGSGLITPLLSKSWKVISQHIDDLNEPEVQALLGKSVAASLLAMGKEEMFADTVQSSKFRVFGVSAVMNKMKEFTKLTAMLQTIVSSPQLSEEFNKKYSFTKLLTEIMGSLDIDTYKLEADALEGGDLSGLTGAPSQASNEVPDLQSQVAQAGAASNQADLNPMAASQPASPQAL